MRKKRLLGDCTSQNPRKWMDRLTREASGDVQALETANDRHRESDWTKQLFKWRDLGNLPNYTHYWILHQSNWGNIWDTAVGFCNGKGSVLKFLTRMLSIQSLEALWTADRWRMSVRMELACMARGFVQSPLSNFSIETPWSNPNWSNKESGRVREI